ncbi:MAG: HutP [Candidatus Riflebacteria bacterium]|nr:HutP [Candidatus Riflebacteria bacterium]
MSEFKLSQFLYQEERLSLSKAALMLAMVDNQLDGEMADGLLKMGIRSVVTRAGGSGDNLKAKILRNTFGAAEKSGFLPVTPRNRYAITKLVEEIIRSFDSPILEVAGGGLKIALVFKDSHLAMAVYGTLGIPGMDVDFEVSVARTLQYYLEE